MGWFILAQFFSTILSLFQASRLSGGQVRLSHTGYTGIVAGYGEAIAYLDSLIMLYRVIYPRIWRDIEQIVFRFEFKNLRS